VITPAPVTLVSGQQRVQLPQGGPWLKLKVANESGYDLSVQVGGQINELGAWVAELYDLHGEHYIDIVASAIQSVGGTPSKVIKLTLAGPGETIEGTYPMALARAVNVYGKRPWDWTGESFPAQGTGFQVIIAAVVGQRHIFNHGSYILINTNAAGATGIGMTVRDRDNNNIILWQSDGGIEGVTGSIDRDEMSDMAVPGSVGGSLAFQAEANVANTTSSGSCGGYDST